MSQGAKLAPESPRPWRKMKVWVCSPLGGKITGLEEGLSSSSSAGEVVFGGGGGEIEGQNVVGWRRVFGPWLMMADRPPSSLFGFFAGSILFALKVGLKTA